MGQGAHAPLGALASGHSGSLLGLLPIGYTAMVPTVLRSEPYRFFFFSGDREEPPHVHVERDRNRAKFWLDPARLQESGRFRSPEIRRIEALVREHQILLLREWHEFFGA
jgi:hypothetical protein